MEIWDHSYIYSICRYYVDWCTATSYSRTTVTGKENIPGDGIIIFAPNHCNALMDALNVLRWDKGPTAFGARADMFRKPLLAKILTFLRIVPLARERDGRQAIADNAGIYDKIGTCLEKGIPFTIFSEGTHRTMHSLLPIKKGVARIAVQTARQSAKPVYIQPIGLDYEDYFRNMVSLKISYGKPIAVSEMIAADPQASDAELYRSICDGLRGQLASLITYFPDDDNYPAAWEKYITEHSRRKTWADYLLSAAALPLFCILAVLAMPMWLPAQLINRGFEDHTWYNTVRFAIKFIGTPILTIIYGTLAALFLPWWAAICVAAATIFLHPAYYLMLRLYRKPTKI